MPTITHKQFMSSVTSTIAKSLRVLLIKRKEYNPGEDALDHFRRAAVMQRCTVRQAVWNLTTKHILRLGDMVCSQTQSVDSREWDAPILDLINYLYILRVTVDEDLGLIEPKVALGPTVGVPADEEPAGTGPVFPSEDAVVGGPEPPVPAADASSSYTPPSDSSA